MGTVGTTKPFSYRDENGELTGFDIELARAIFDGSDQYELTFETTDGSGQFPGLDSGRFDLLGNNTSYTKSVVKNTSILIQRPLHHPF